MRFIGGLLRRKEPQIQLLRRKNLQSEGGFLLLNKRQLLWLALMAQAQGHILIVDDEPAVVYTLRCILEKVGYTVSEAERLEQVVAVLESRTVDVVLCDLGLSG